ncbi:NAD(P)/FAD-dependent oxidoreductase [Halobacillus ihumii]|uniref:NAD(P)/FAD-dependent oxidoreductase n=1 Tax=Halobacillus ihumii TaxID=2686092 RepID=UPI0013D38BA9|nr:NAD(P)/FAD-dependent oxidoreductase [Halobacillus ihumii]
MDEAIIDVVIIGGGPGGLSAALVLGRSCRNVVIVDKGTPRNSVTFEAHGLLTRDGIKPQELRQIARQQLTSYPNVTCFDEEVIQVEKHSNQYIVTTHLGNTFKTRRVIVATGMIDELPAIPGFREVYGMSVFPCPYCDGWERRGEPLAVFGNEENVVPFTKLLNNWSNDLILFTNGAAQFDSKFKQELAAHAIATVETPIAKLQSADGKLEKVITETGEAFSRTGGFILNTREKQAFDLPKQLGIQMNERGGYESDDHGLTSVEGLYVIGDAKNSFVGLAGAVGEGYEAGVVINHELAMEDWVQEEL